MMFKTLMLILRSCPLWKAKTVTMENLKNIRSIIPDSPKSLEKKIKANNPKALSEIFKKVEGLNKKDLTKPSEVLYLEYFKTGKRHGYDDQYNTFCQRLSNIAVAAYLSDNPKYINLLEYGLKELCDMRTWVGVAHACNKKNFDGKIINIDIFSSHMAFNASAILALMGERLSQKIRNLTIEKINKFVMKPFYDMVSRKRKKDWWMTTKNNWNAVCLRNICGTILISNIDKKDKVKLLNEVVKYSKFFLKGFTPDGYCSEGVGYWKYGFGINYLHLAFLIYCATDGEVNIAKHPKVAVAASYPDRIMIAPNVFPAFADCDYNIVIHPEFLGVYDYLSNIPSQRWLSIKPGMGLYIGEFLIWAAIPEMKVPAKKTVDLLPYYDIFPDGGVIVLRPGPESNSRIAVAFKGGSNHEFHNHNDIGSYVISLDGKLPIMCDPGNEVYTARTFSEKRYQSKVLNSYAHAVPRINGILQSEGKKTDAPIISKKFDLDNAIVKIDMAPAYPEAKNLKKLERTFEYKRTEGGLFSVADEGLFFKPVTFETALISFGNFTQTKPDILKVTYNKQVIEVKIDTKGEPFTISSERINEKIVWKEKPLRIAIELNNKTTKPYIKTTFRPVVD